MALTTSIARRRFLAWSGAATVSGVAAYLNLPKGPVAPSNSPEATVPKQKAVAFAAGKPTPGYNHQAFVANVGGEFGIDLPGVTSGSCKLIEVSPAREMKTEAGNFTTFSVMFESHSGMPADGAICRVTHPELDPMEMFLSPVGRKLGDKVLLEAAFTLRC